MVGEGKERVLANGFLVLVILVSISMVFSGCVDKKPEASEDEYWEHMKAITDALSKVPSDEEYKRAYYEGDIDKAILVLEEMEKFTGIANYHANLAINSTQDPAKREKAEAFAKSTEYGLLFQEKRIEAFELKKEGRDEEALESMEKSNEYSQLALEWAKKSTELK